MPRPSRPLVLLAALALAAAGCVPTGASPTAPRPTASARPTPRPGGGTPAPGAALAKIPAEDLALATAGRTARAIDASLPAATLVGKVRLIANNGGGIIGNNGGRIIGNNGGRIISNHGGGIVSDNGAGIVSDNGAGLVGKTRYGVRQATTSAQAEAEGEVLLADAVVTVHDAAGRMLTLPDGTPIAAVTDKTGAYKLEAPLPAEGVVLRVRLWTGGELVAMAPKQAAAEREAPIDTATSLGAAYVLDRFVKGDQGTYDKLPASEAAALRDAIEAARGQLAATPKYEPAELVALADGLQAKAPAVARKLEDIKALLIGQAALGDGRPATEVAIPNLSALLVDRRGHLLMVDRGTGRIRDLAPDGMLSTLADFARGTRIKQNFPGALDLAEGPDGALYVADRARVHRIALDGQVTTIAGNGQVKRDTLVWNGDIPPKDQAIQPAGLAVGADGTVYVADRSQPSAGGVALGRLVAIGPDGRGREFVGGWPVDMWPAEVAGGPGGAIHVLLRRGAEALVARVKPDGAYEPGSAVVYHTDLTPDLVRGADGSVFVVHDEDGLLEAVPADGGLVSVVAGDGAPAGGPVTLAGPATTGPDGTLYVVDQTSMRIFARAPGGAWRGVAGAEDKIGRTGDLTAIALNRPYGVAFDDKGGVLFSESGGYRVRRFDGTAITTIVGGGLGFGGDGGAATAARLRRPSGLAWHDGTLWIVDEGNQRLRKVGPDGRIETVMGGGQVLGQAGSGADLPKQLLPGQRVPADKCKLVSARAVAIGPDGRPYVVLTEAGQVWRLAADGMVELVAGRVVEPERNEITSRLPAVPVDANELPADQLSLVYPSGAAFDAAGDLLVADTFGLRVWRISGLASARPMARPAAGMSVAAAIVAGSAMEGADLRRPALELPLSPPSGIAVDRAGRLLVGCLGSDAFTALGASIGFNPGDVLGMRSFGAFVIAVDKAGMAAPAIGMQSRVLADPNAEDPLLTATGLAVGPDGRLAIADAGANLLRIVPAGAY